eukprot:1326589-Amorphochlora_amoeboformis.AAC.1
MQLCRLSPHSYDVLHLKKIAPIAAIDAAKSNVRISDQEHLSTAEEGKEEENEGLRERRESKESAESIEREAQTHTQREGKFTGKKRKEKQEKDISDGITWRDSILIGWREFLWLNRRCFRLVVVASVFLQILEGAYSLNYI